MTTEKRRFNRDLSGDAPSQAGARVFIRRLMRQNGVSLHPGMDEDPGKAGPHLVRWCLERPEIASRALADAWKDLISQPDVETVPSVRRQVGAMALLSIALGADHVHFDHPKGFVSLQRGDVYYSGQLARDIAIMMKDAEME